MFLIKFLLNKSLIESQNALNGFFDLKNNAGNWNNIIKYSNIIAPSNNKFQALSLNNCSSFSESKNFLNVSIDSKIPFIEAAEIPIAPINFIPIK